MRLLVLLASLAIAAPALAQHNKRDEHRGVQQQGRNNMSHEERQRLREDVNSARGNYGGGNMQRPDPRRQDRMAPADRERLRRDVQDANREMGRR